MLSKYTRYYTDSSKAEEYEKCLIKISQMSKDNCWSAVLNAKRCLAREDKYKLYFYETLKKLEELLEENSADYRQDGTYCYVSKNNIYADSEVLQNCFHHSSMSDSGIDSFINKTIERKFSDDFIIWIEDTIEELKTEPKDGDR